MSDDQLQIGDIVRIAGVYQPGKGWGGVVGQIVAIDESWHYVEAYPEYHKQIKGFGKCRGGFSTGNLVLVHKMSSPVSTERPVSCLRRWILL
jgi:hypothetical protein